MGETSRSSYQRGVEHERDIAGGVLSHPMVLHFWEEHQGRHQEYIMRTISKHQSPLEWQVVESVNINVGMRKQEECLNLRVGA